MRSDRHDKAPTRDKPRLFGAGVTDTPNPQDEIREAVARALDPYAAWEGNETVPPHLRRSYANQRTVALDNADAATAAHKRALAKAGHVIVPRDILKGLVDALRRITDETELVLRVNFGSGPPGDRLEDMPVISEARAMIAKAEEEMEE